MRDTKMTLPRGSKTVASALALLLALLLTFSAFANVAIFQVVDAQEPPHASLLLVDPIKTVKQGSDVTVIGSLIDGTTFDPDNGIVDFLPGKNIDFSGDGAVNLSPNPAVTDESVETAGLFLATGASLNSVGYSWTVNIDFAGDEFYEPTSVPLTYATADADAIEFDVVYDAADPDEQIDLAGLDFPASVDLAKVNPEVTDGDIIIFDWTLFAWQCVSPDTTVQNRFIPLHYTSDGESACLETLEGYPGQELATGEAVRVTMSFAGSDLAPPYTSNDVGIFYQDPISGTITEVTESRGSDSIVGKATSTGRFIVGVALHADAADGSVRKPVLVGDNQQVRLRNVDSTANNTATIEPLGELTLGEPVTLNITYENGNLDPAAVDTLAVKINSTSSNPDSITIIATETGMSTEVFTGTFTPVSGATSGSSLHISAGDQLTIKILQQSYDGRFMATLDGVSKAGLVEMKDYEIDQDDVQINDGFTPVAGVVGMTLVDSDLAAGGKITVTMSYANALMGTYPPVDNLGQPILKIYKSPGPGQSWSQISNISVDTTAKTVSGETTTGGLFVAGIPVGSPGGAGGGLGKPGRGIVLDMAIAFAVQQAASGGSSGGSISHSSASTPLSVTEQVSRGTDSEVTLTVTGTQSSEGNTITLNFEEVSQGRLFLTERQASELGSIFESTTPTGGSLSIGGSGFTTAGPVYNIDATEVVFSGTVDVTLPYDQSLVGSEQNVRFLHHDGKAWQDATIGIDEQANTVTGRVRSLSPVVVGIVSDGTFDAAYFALNPLKKFSVLNATLSTAEFSAGAGPVEITHAGKLDLVTVSAVLKNMQRADQTYALIVQVIDDGGITRSLSLQEGSLAVAQQVEVSSSWTVEEEGRYTIQIFVWDRVEGIPSSLAGATVKSLDAQ